ncbi:diaminopimelate decarboxylase [Gemmatirosa kalamazoonensis]|uniref:Diaminopimelate decarboxylase n=1 Tax=Gemmatirosa kalamazoonensis TaxID=861299 RepID=W0RJH1_9BACT|nr:diaminopimelate decarboxylase [Gemmatirosa kalamazoonensis]AHG90926.1 diaminopimelate decarboxylase [Gemmatirosa kalamazoonensis]
MGQGVLSAAAVGPDFEPGFSSRDGELYCDAVPAGHIAEAVGTPAYVYSAGVVRQQYRRLDAALGGVPHRVHYSVKANSNLAILRLLQAEGAGVDIVSGGELYRAREAGFAGRDIVFSGVGKTARELDEALAEGVLFVNVESEGELVVLDEVARARGMVAPVALRVNPEVMVDSPHHYIRTGEKGHKFGIPYDDVRDAARLTRSLPNVELVGIDMHIGSQLSSFEPYADALERVSALVTQLRADDFDRIRYLDVGGGLGVVYRDEPATDVERYAEGVARAARALDVTLVLEPGRFLVAEAGLLLTKVLYRKRSGGKEYVITDAGMNDLLRPSHYEAFHEIVATRPRGHRVVADVVGPVCESGDFLARNRVVDDARPGDVLGIRTAGAYGFVMASNYNSRPRPAEVLVDGDRYAVVTERERYEDLVRQERAALDWRTA